MPVTPKVQKLIWGLFAGRCAICRERVIEADGVVQSLTGEVAHMAGEKPGAARYDRTMSQAERDDPDNLMLLCRKDHKIIDDNEAAFPLSKLEDIRTACLGWLTGQLEAPSPWSLRVAAFTYLNVPRLVEYASLNGFKINPPALSANQTLHALGFELVHVIENFRRPLEAMTIASLAPDQIDFAHEDYIGQIVRFDRLRIRTRNVPGDIPSHARADLFTGDLERDPHIYHRFRS